MGCDARATGTDQQAVDDARSAFVGERDDRLRGGEQQKHDRDRTRVVGDRARGARTLDRFLVGREPRRAHRARALRCEHAEGHVRGGPLLVGEAKQLRVDRLEDAPQHDIGQRVGERLLHLAVDDRRTQCACRIADDVNRGVRPCRARSARVAPNDDTGIDDAAPHPVAQRSGVRRGIGIDTQRGIGAQGRDEPRAGRTAHLVDDRDPQPDRVAARTGEDRGEDHENHRRQHERHRECAAVARECQRHDAEDRTDHDNRASPPAIRRIKLARPGCRMRISLTPRPTPSNRRPCSSTSA